MNLKPTKKKFFASIVLPIVIWILVFFVSLFKIANLPAIITNFLALHDFSNFFSTGNIALFVFEIIIVYLFLSIFQRKKKSSAYPQQANPAQMPAQTQ